MQRPLNMAARVLYKLTLVSPSQAHLLPPTLQSTFQTEMFLKPLDCAKTPASAFTHTSFLGRHVLPPSRLLAEAQLRVLLGSEAGVQWVEWVT